MSDARRSGSNDDGRRETAAQERNARAGADDAAEAEHQTAVTISGPGAADFLAAQGGDDLPGSSGSKGMGQTRGEDLLRGRRLEPHLEPSETDPEAGAPPADPLRRI